MEKRNNILKSLYVHSLPSNGVKSGISSDNAQFSSQLLVAVNRLSSDEAAVELVRCQLVLFRKYLLPLTRTLSSYSVNWMH